MFYFLRVLNLDSTFYSANPSKFTSFGNPDKSLTDENSNGPT
jgi:hypothetical protein